MNAFSIFSAHVRARLIELFRIPAFTVPTLLFPALFFVMFAAPWVHGRDEATGAMLSFVAFAVIGVTLFQFGVGVSAERAQPWERYIRTLPAPLIARFGARVICAIVFGVLSAALVVAVALLRTPAHLSAAGWFELLIFTLAGGIPFVLFGLAIGYWTNGRAAVPIANIFYLLLSFAGGLWMPPSVLPHFAQVVSPYLPTRQFGELLWSISGSHAPIHALAVLAVYAALFAAIAAAGYRRDERMRYA
ncbi:MAG: ABC transporter permease [Candidatus Eremiobacteraeota bacterium]|nr:ABC transporter permease [Candidatus Eremiobacteraeota bacterium]